MKNFVSKGYKVEFLAGAAYLSGAVVVLGCGVGIVDEDVASGATGIASIVGAFNLAKNTGESWSAGDPLVWDAGNSWFSNVPAAGLKPVAFARIVAASADVLADIILAPSKFVQAAVVAPLTGTVISGFTPSSAMTTPPHVSTAGGNTYADSTINAAIDNINQVLNDLGAKQNAMLVAMKAAGIMANA